MLIRIQNLLKRHCEESSALWDDEAISSQSKKIKLLGIFSRNRSLFPLVVINQGRILRFLEQKDYIPFPFHIQGNQFFKRSQQTRLQDFFAFKKGIHS